MIIIQVRPQVFLTVLLSGRLHTVLRHRDAKARTYTLKQ